MINVRVDGGIGSAIVETVVSDRTRAALMRLGAFIRRRAQTSIRYRKRKSRPGEPPTGWRSKAFTRLKTNKKTGASSRQPASPLRELIAFAVSADGTTLIVGPMIFRNSAVGGGQAPRLLEEGGTGTFLDDGQRKVGKWLPRPTMGPAFRAELPKAPKLFGSG